MHPPPARSAATGPSGGRSIQRLQLTPVLDADIPPNVARLATTRTSTTASTALNTSAVVLRRRSEDSIPFVCKSASSSDNAARLSNCDTFCSSSAKRSTKSWPIPGKHAEAASVARGRAAHTVSRLCRVNVHTVRWSTRRRLRYRNRDICGVFSLKGFSKRLRNGCSLPCARAGACETKPTKLYTVNCSHHSAGGASLRYTVLTQGGASRTSRRRTAGPTNSPSHKQAAASSSSLLAACRAARERMDSNGTKCTRSAAKFFSKFNPTCQGRAHP